MPELTVSEMLFDGECPHANMPPRQRESTPSARGCGSRLTRRTAPDAVWVMLVSDSRSRGVNRPPELPLGFPTTAANYPVGRTVRNVGRTGATRVIPWENRLNY